MSCELVRLNNGRCMPIIGLGTYKLRGDAVQEPLKAALTAGYRSIDTASVYRNEADIGKCLKEELPKINLQRSDLFITSKLAPRHHGDTKCRQAVQESLQALQTDYLDLYLIHWPGVQSQKHDDPSNSRLRQESWRAMEELHKEGVLRSIGVSNYTIKHLKELLSHCSVKPAVLQTEYHPHLIQKEVLNFCQENDMHLQAYSSLGTSSDNNQILSDIQVKQVAESCKKSAPQVLLRWAVQQGVGVIPKSSSPEHIQENIDIFSFTLSDQEMDTLNQLDKQHHYCWNPNTVT